MMGERRVAQEALFYEFSLERHVPADHLLRAIDRVVDLSGLRSVGSTGAPLIEGSIAQAECLPHAQVDAGDHTIFIGRVVDGAIERPECEPLLFFRGGYRGISSC
jgi:flavin reductase (DIM6/NTAB) family NADH-FMN oxidoreductase RutF